ncbi:hypothetical protein BT96DRAFT_1011933 [Gymnopus androsaceus JB14]|uniref:Cytochrome c oxidase subunit 8, mitochondrial n=1 Tax=Gymnopus androsaceus JB14 TaxID=1447944 RepID=A0A6A4IDS2_9AGAR|nr:hypothetical protein BT96DRAFT_1011933 [Gymnopus androsaceus JB14]
MSLALASRSAARAQSHVFRRQLHASNVVRSPHGEYHHLPFAWPGDKKAGFAIKLVAYLGFGFSIPFIAGFYQIKKSGA